MAKKVVDIDDKSFDIYYDIINPKEDKTIIFLHGWGSNKEIMKTAFANKFDNLKHIYIDMPGFGKSTTEYILYTTDYAKIIDKFLDSIGVDKYIVVGHSFGGKVATILNPKNLVLLSTAGIVESKPISVQIKIKLFKILKSIGLGRFYKIFASKDVDNMSQNMYETFKNVVDEDFSEYFKNHQGDTYIFWGIDDTAVSLNSGKLINSYIQNSKFYPLNGDHYFFLDSSNIDEISKIVSKLK
jgi:pimeloyl-ACP methyl ester carboxylesterase